MNWTTWNVLERIETFWNNYCGLREFLFENATDPTSSGELQNNIVYQFERYLPSVILTDIKTLQENNFLLVKVFYILSEFNLEDFLEIRVEN